MKTIAWSLLTTLFALTMSSTTVQASGLAPSIMRATWESHSEYYSRSPLCEDNDITLWSCTVRKQEYALCSSRVMTRDRGYMQYRASQASAAVLVYPAVKRSPAGLFVYTAFPNGDASIEFETDGHRYTLVDLLRGDSSMVTSAPDGASSKITCGGQSNPSG